MHTITALTVKGGYILQLRFDNGQQKLYDCNKALMLTAFEPFRNYNIFTQVQKKGYYIEWPQLEIDISADTLWHDSVGFN